MVGKAKSLLMCCEYKLVTCISVFTHLVSFYQNTQYTHSGLLYILHVYIFSSLFSAFLLIKSFQSRTFLSGKELRVTLGGQGRISSWEQQSSLCCIVLFLTLGAAGGTVKF